MTGFLTWIENSSFSTWVRTTPSIWGYAMMLYLHTLGLAVVVGVSAMIDLRLLGFARRMPIAPLDRFFPVIWTGFWISAASGAILLAQDATAKLTDPVFGVKMTLIALAALDLVFVRRVVARARTVDSPVSGVGRFLAVSSLALWFAAATVGRLMAYIGAGARVPVESSIDARLFFRMMS